jgi:signal transduction histidine kinase
VKILEAMLRSCGQMDRLIRNFADLSSVEADAVELRFAEHDAGAMLEVVAESVKERAAASSVRVEIEKPAGRLTLSCDHDRLVRALGHLVDNAIAAAPEGSTVSLAATRRGGDLAFLVIDRGTGPTDEVREHLFDRAFLTKKAGRAGAAFGLAIARGFARAHQGDVALTSKTGEPTTFALTVPLPVPQRS